MAKGKKTGGKDFQPGKPGGPGRPPTSPEMKVARKLTKTLFEDIVHRFTAMTKDELVNHIRNPNTPTLELMVATVVKESILKGDHVRLSFVLDRLIGRVKESIEHTGKDGEPLVFTVKRYIDG